MLRSLAGLFIVLLGLCATDSFAMWLGQDCDNTVITHHKKPATTIYFNTQKSYPSNVVLDTFDVTIDFTGCHDYSGKDGWWYTHFPKQYQSWTGNGYSHFRGLNFYIELIFSCTGTNACVDDKGKFPFTKESLNKKGILFTIAFEASGLDANGNSCMTSKGNGGMSWAFSRMAEESLIGDCRSFEVKIKGSWLQNAVFPQVGAVKLIPEYSFWVNSEAGAALSYGAPILYGLPYVFVAKPPAPTPPPTPTPIKNCKVVLSSRPRS